MTTLGPAVLNNHELGAKRVEDLPPNSVYIGRRQTRGGYRLPESKWANKLKEPRDGTRDEVIAKYAARVMERPDLMAALPELRGKDVVCWCARKPCHGEVLLRLAREAAEAEQQ